MFWLKWKQEAQWMLVDENWEKMSSCWCIRCILTSRFSDKLRTAVAILDSYFHMSRFKFCPNHVTHKTFAALNIDKQAVLTIKQLTFWWAKRVLSRSSNRYWYLLSCLTAVSRSKWEQRPSLVNGCYRYDRCWVIPCSCDHRSYNQAMSEG